MKLIDSLKKRGEWWHCGGKNSAGADIPRHSTGIGDNEHARQYIRDIDWLTLDEWKAYRKSEKLIHGAYPRLWVVRREYERLEKKLAEEKAKQAARLAKAKNRARRTDPVKAWKSAAEDAQFALLARQRNEAAQRAVMERDQRMAENRRKGNL